MEYTHYPLHYDKGMVLAYCSLSTYSILYPCLAFNYNLWSKYWCHVKMGTPRPQIYNRYGDTLRNFGGTLIGAVLVRVVNV